LRTIDKLLLEITGRKLAAVVTLAVSAVLRTPAEASPPDQPICAPYIWLIEIIGISGATLPSAIAHPLNFSQKSLIFKQID